MQVFPPPHHDRYHQQHSTLPWGPPPHMERPMTPPPRQMYNPYTGAPVASPNRYSNQATYAAQSREAPYEGMYTRQSYLPPHLSTEGQPYNTQPPHHSTQAPPYNTQHGHLAGHDVYNTQQFRSSGHDLAQTPSRSIMTPHDHAERQVQRGLGPAMGHDSCGTTRSMAIGGDYRGTPMGHDSCGTSRSLSTGGDYRGGRGRTTPDREAEVASPTHTSRIGRQTPVPTPSAHTRDGPGTLHTQHGEPPMEHLGAPVTSSNPQLLSTNSSKSSPPYTSSQRKQLRVEEKSYLKEVKSAIAEGRVPRVLLKQNNNGHILQYKAQFMNALKLAALAIVPDADIDIHNPLTMQEIMREVRRQFIIEKPLPKGFICGYLQRLYKRNRAMYHRHWTQHGDERKPDDCSLAAWSQLVDYWKSMEGNKECERNKTTPLPKKRPL